MADKDLEIESCKEKIDWLEKKICQLQKQIYDNEEKHNQELEKVRKDIASSTKPQDSVVDLPEKSAINLDQEKGQGDNMVRNIIFDVNICCSLVILLNKLSKGSFVVFI